MQTMRWKPQNLPLHKTFSTMQSTANEKLSIEPSNTKWKQNKTIWIKLQTKEKVKEGGMGGGEKMLLC